MIRSHIEINRSPSDVFAYVEELDRHGEWQDAIISARKEPAGSTRIGTHNFEMRRMPGGPRQVESEIVEYEPPRRIAARGVNGPVRATVVITLEPFDGGSRSRFTIELTLVGRGIGKLFALLARRSARKQVPRDLLRLKRILEGRSGCCFSPDDRGRLTSDGADAALTPGCRAAHPTRYTHHPTSARSIRLDPAPTGAPTRRCP